MAMGLCNAPATFQTIIYLTCRDAIDKFVVIYLDELLLISETKEDHMLNLELVLERRKTNEIYVYPKKCKLFQEEVEFLGLLAGQNGIRVDPQKIEVIVNLPKPKDWTGLSGVLGLSHF